jgi:hypothetical protein
MVDNWMETFKLSMKNSSFIILVQIKLFHTPKSTIRDPSFVKLILFMLDITGFLLNYYYM